MSSNYPPGVTGNEPQITGIWPLDAVADTCSEDIKKATEHIEDAISYLDDQGYAEKSDHSQAETIIRLLDDWKQDIIYKVESQEPEYEPFDEEVG